MTFLSPLLNRRFLSLWILSILGGIVMAPFASQFQIYVEAELLRSAAVSANLRSVFLLLGGLWALPGGALCDAVGRRRTYLLGLTGIIATGMIFLTGSIPLLVLLCLYAGAGSGLLTTAGQTYLMGSAPATSMGIAAAFFFMGQTLGNALGNGILAPVIDEIAFGSLGRGMAGAGLLLVAAAAVAMPHQPVVNPPSQIFSLEMLRGYVALLLRREVRLLVAMRFLPTCYWGVVTQLISLYIYRAALDLGLPHPKGAAATYAWQSLVAASAFQMLTGRLADRLGMKGPVITTSALVTVSALLLGCFSDSLSGLFVFGIATTAAAWSLSTTMPGLVNFIAGEGEKGRVLGVTHLAWSAGMLAGTLGGGWADAARQAGWTAVPPGLPFFVGSLCCAATFACALLLFRGGGPGAVRIGD